MNPAQSKTIWNDNYEIIINYNLASSKLGQMEAIIKDAIRCIQKAFNTAYL